MILNIKQITNKNLLYSTKKYTQYIVITYKEKNLKMYICIFFIWEKAMAPHSSTLAWKIPWAEEPGRLQSMGSLRVKHD